MYNIFNYIILEIFLEFDEVYEYQEMIEILKNYLNDYINGRRNEKVDNYVKFAIRIFDKHLSSKTIYKHDIDTELYELLELANNIMG
jgi:hypothetical protein